MWSTPELEKGGKWDLEDQLAGSQDCPENLLSLLIH